MRIVRTLSSQRNPVRQQKDPCSFLEPLLTEDGLWLEPIIAVVCKRDCVEIALLTEYGEPIIPLLVNDCYVAPPPPCEDRYLLTQDSLLITAEDGTELLSFGCNPALVTYEAGASIVSVNEVVAYHNFSNQRLIGNLVNRHHLAAIRVRYIPFSLTTILGLSLVEDPMIKNHGTPDPIITRFVIPPVWHNFTYPQAFPTTVSIVAASSYVVISSRTSIRQTHALTARPKLTVPSSVLKTTIRLETVDPNAHYPASAAARITNRLALLSAPVINQPAVYAPIRTALELTQPPVHTVPLYSFPVSTLRLVANPINNIVFNDIITLISISEAEANTQLARIVNRHIVSVANKVHQSASTLSTRSTLSASPVFDYPKSRAVITNSVLAMTSSYSFMTSSLRLTARPTLKYIDTSATITNQVRCNTYRLSIVSTSTLTAQPVVKYSLINIVMEVRLEVVANIFRAYSEDVILNTCNASPEYEPPISGDLDGGYYPLPVPPYPTYDLGDAYYPILYPEDLKAIYDAASY